MTKKRSKELTRAGRHRVVTGVLLRAAATVTLLTVGYYLAPLDRPLDPGTLIAFVLALAVVGAVIAWQVRNILTSDVPRLRGVQTIAVGVPMLLLVFASVGRLRHRRIKRQVVDVEPQRQLVVAPAQRPGQRRRRLGDDHARFWRDVVTSQPPPLLVGAGPRVLQQLHAGPAKGQEQAKAPPVPAAAASPGPGGIDADRRVGVGICRRDAQ
jgi:hypothetical protein